MAVASRLGESNWAFCFFFLDRSRKSPNLNSPPNFPAIRIVCIIIKAKLSGVDFRFKIAATHCCDGNSTTLVHDFSPEVPPIVNFSGDV